MTRILFLTLTGLIAACSSSKKMENIPLVKESWFQKEQGSQVKFSEQSQLPAVEQRDYVRMSRERLERESDLGAAAGSMWVMEGQGAYLFTQNKTRRDGDLLNVKLEGPMLRQAQIKVSVIKKLLDQLDAENEKMKQKDRSPQNPATPAPEAERGLAADTTPEEPELEIESVPTRIVERLPDGNYRVTGQQPFMLGQREFKVLVTGLVRPEDFSDDGTSSNRLIDSEVDVLSVRKDRNERLQ